MRILYISDFYLHCNVGKDGKTSRPACVFLTFEKCVGIFKIYGYDSKIPGKRVKLDKPISGGNRDSSWVDLRPYFVTDDGNLIQIGKNARIDIKRTTRSALSKKEVSMIIDALGGKAALFVLKKKARNRINSVLNQKK